MKFFLSLILFLSSLHSAISEFKSDDYQIIIGKNFDDEALDITEDYDNNISVVGYTQDFKTSSNSGASFNNAFDYLHTLKTNHGEQLRLIKLNKAAEIVNDINFKIAEVNRGTNIIKTIHNGYLLGGYTHNGQMLIASLDVKGKQHYLKRFGTANFDRLHALVKLDDGSHVAIGTSQTSRNTRDDMFVQGLGYSDVYLVKYSADGQLNWKKKYGTTGKDTGIDGISTEDGGFILLSISQEENKSQLVVTKINDTGDTVWMKTFAKPGRNKAYKIAKTAQSDYIISASFENKDNKDNIRLIKIDKNGNHIWEKNIYSPSHQHLNDISIDLKGNIIGVGSIQSKSDMDALVRYYDANANMIWERTFGKNRQDSFSSIAVLHDNSFAIAGFSNSFADKAKQIWLLKMNDDGSMAKKDMKKYENIHQALKQELIQNKAIQQKTSANVQITKPKIFLFKDLRITHDGLIFKQGSSTLTPQHKSILKEFIPRLMKTLLPYKDKIKNIKIKGFTSTEWNAPDTQRYLKNAHLSNERAMHVLEYSYQLSKVQKFQKWMSDIFSTDGFSYSNLVYEKDKENKILSRRVEFEINLK